MTTKKSHTKPRRAKHRAKALKTAPLGKTVKPGEPVTVDRGATCSHPGAGGPCMPRVRDGRCVWCERLMPARSEGPLPPGLVERAAERIGYNPAGFAPEEQAEIDRLERSGLPVSDIGRTLIRQLREQGQPAEQIKYVLQREARGLTEVASLLSPSPKGADAMLRDALEVLASVRDVFYCDGELGDDPGAIMREALRSAEQEFDMFSAMREHSGSELHWQELWRAGYRMKLARKLAEFRAKHPEWKPAETKETEPAKEGAA